MCVCLVVEEDGELMSSGGNVSADISDRGRRGRRSSMTVLCFTVLDMVTN
jgi:hypothetical protein